MPSLTVDLLMAEQGDGLTAHAQDGLHGQRITRSPVRTFLQSTYCEPAVLINSSRRPTNHCGDGKLWNVCVLADMSGTSFKSNHTRVFTLSGVGRKEHKPPSSALTLLLWRLPAPAINYCYCTIIFILVLSYGTFLLPLRLP